MREIGRQQLFSRIIPELVRTRLMCGTCTDPCRKDAVIDRFLLDRQFFQPIFEDPRFQICIPAPVLNPDSAAG